MNRAEIKDYLQKISRPALNGAGLAAITERLRAGIMRRRIKAPKPNQREQISGAGMQPPLPGLVDRAQTEQPAAGMHTA